MTITVNTHEAKTRLSELLTAAERGEDVVIARAGKPVARLVPVAPAKPRRRIPGSARGEFTISPDFDAPMTEAELAEWVDAPLVAEPR